MPFQPGNKYGGYRDGSGRPSTKELKEIKTAADRARARLEGSVEKIMGTYVGLAASGQDPATTRHAVDKLLPDEKHELQGTVINVNFVQFNNNQHSLQLPAAGISGAILAGNGNGNQAGGEGLAQTERQGQNGLKFHDFEDVP